MVFMQRAEMQHVVLKVKRFRVLWTLHQAQGYVMKIIAVK